MLTGIVQSDTLSQLLQSIAGKRKQGELEITLPEQVVKIAFIQGRIVEFQAGSSAPAGEVAERLQRSSSPPTPFIGGGYAALYEWGRNGAIPPERIALAIAERLHERLLSFTLTTTVPWGFRVGGVEVDRELAASISVSQMLLDHTEISPVHAQFAGAFTPGDLVMRSSGEGGSPLECELLAQLDTPRSIEELRHRVVLSPLHFEQTALKLLGDGVITVGKGSVSVEQRARAAESSAPTAMPGEGARRTTDPVSHPSVAPRRWGGGRSEKQSDPFAQAAYLAVLLIVIGALVFPVFLWEATWQSFQ